MTTIDYELVNDACSFLLKSCFTHEEHPLNTADHLLNTTTLQFASNIPLSFASALPKVKINWKRVLATDEILVYAEQVDKTLIPFIGTTYDNISQVNEQISTVTKLLVNCSCDCLPIQQHINNSKN